MSAVVTIDGNSANNVVLILPTSRGNLRAKTPYTFRRISANTLAGNYLNIYYSSTESSEAYYVIASNTYIFAQAYRAVKI